MGKGSGEERGLREQFNFLDDGRSGFGTNSPSARLHIANIRDASDTLTVAVTQERATFIIESFGGATANSLRSYPLIRLLQSRGIGSGGDVIRPLNGDSMGAIDFVASKGQQDGKALTAAKLDVKFRASDNAQTNTADFLFTTSDWLTPTTGNPGHSLITRFSILGDRRIGVNTQFPTTNLFVQGSMGTSTNTQALSSSSDTISVKGKSTIFLSSSGTNDTINLEAGEDEQRVIVVNLSENYTITVNSTTSPAVINPTRDKEFVYNLSRSKWYVLGND